ncbi:MAG: hypothetical protein HQK59_17355 [Deltaproteobacteria bacterium]|nr:hypothetical protein [Deltaproteobacteria bacterium]
MISTIGGFLFLALGIIVAWLMLEVIGRKDKVANPAGYRLWHKRLGWAFILLYLLFLSGMVLRLSGMSDELDVRPFAHALLGLLLFPLLTIKVLFARRYKSFMGNLPTLGLIIVATSFLLIMLTAGYDLIAVGQGPGTPAAAQSAGEDQVAEGKSLVPIKCTHCHSLDRVWAADKTPARWQSTVKTMASKQPGWINDDQANAIISFLSQRKK